jgi:NADPH-dependent 2,4-dienoyl-CoA reductase/sulfur reductase-like enzyme
MSSPIKVAIIGGVAGGMSAATRLRRLDAKAEITVFERSNYVSYANCGLPYFLGGVIDERDNLLLQTPESLHARFELDVRVNQEITAIDRTNKSLTGRNLISGETFTHSYDFLILSPGASAIKPPNRSPYFFSVLTLTIVPGARLAAAIRNFCASSSGVSKRSGRCASRNAW